MLRTAIAMTLLLLLHCAVVAQAKSFDIAREKKDLLEYLADKHSDLGKDYFKATLYSDGRAHYGRAMDLVHEHEKSMKALGFEYRDKRWTLDKKKQPPEKDGLDGVAAKEKRDEMARALAADYKRMGDKIRGVAKRARDAAAADDARVIESLLFFYAPEDAEARKARGHVKVGEEWGPAFAKAARDAGMVVLQAAVEGEKVETEDPQGKEIGAKFFARKGTHVIARAVESDERAARLHKVIEGAIALSVATLNLEAPVFGSGQTFSVLNKREHYLAMVEKFSGKEGKDLELSKKLSGCNQQKPWGFFCHENTWPAGDDMHANTVAINVLHAFRRDNSAPWVTTGFSYLVTARLLGTTNTVRYTIEEEGSTSAGGSGSGELNMNKKGGGPAKLRGLALDMAQTGRDTPLVKLAGLDLNSLKMEQAAKAFSFFEFGTEKYPEQTRKWLAMKPGNGAAEIKNIEAAFGKSAEELDNEWRQWVQVNY